MVSKVDICNLALSILGNDGTINSIDNPESDVEKIFSVWYDLTRRIAIKKASPNFARARAILPLSKYTPVFGYSKAFEYRSDCVRVLGVGNLDEINEYVIEGKHLLTEYAGESLPIRYIKDIEDPKEFDSLFVEYFACLLAQKVASDVTADANAISYVEQRATRLLNDFVSSDRQENKPIRVTDSNILNARRGFKTVRSKK